MVKPTVGIDPGLSGAVALLGVHGAPIHVIDTPVFVKAGTKGRHEYNVPSMVALMAGLVHSMGASQVDVFIERQQAMPGQGVASMFKIGFGYGLWIGILTSMELAYTVVGPRSWQGEMYMGVPGEGKERSMVAVSRLFPKVDIGKSYRGRADALLIAEYGRRVMSRG